jgi:hypothetical protein
MVLYPLVSSLAIYYSYLPTSIMPVITRSQSKMKTSSILERSMFQTSLTGFYAELSDGEFNIVQIPSVVASSLQPQYALNYFDNLEIPNYSQFENLKPSTLEQESFHNILNSNFSKMEDDCEETRIPRPWLILMVFLHLYLLRLQCRINNFKSRFC